jgi:molybdopterin-guanine dinucleotide biosynthesis protein A
MMVAGGILAGGKSERMGAPKALLELAPGTRLVDHVLAEVSAVCQPVLISANDPTPFADLGCAIVADATPGHGPLGGLAALLEAVRPRALLVVACDMPRVARAVLARLVEIARRERHDVVVPRTGGNLHVLCAVWTEACLGPIRARLASGRRDVHGLLGSLRARVVEEAELADLDPGGRSFENVNTPEDLARVLGSRS